MGKIRESVFQLLVCIMMFLCLVGMLFLIDQPKEAVQTEQPKVEEPQRITGHWQIIMFQSRLFPPPTIKTTSYYIKDKVIWYLDTETGEELPLEGDWIVLPDDGRDLEPYGIYKLKGD
jgi:hypothetical protein